ncbi:MAG: bifunctional precorrin-2 dehydrogenase/sirohydrochlorin ferrochelatase [Nitrospirota bacterium]
MNYYPVFLNLKNKRTVVIGGGKVAERKIIQLIKSGADITVVSPALTTRLLKEKAAKKFRHISRRYVQGDLKNAFLVIAATDSPEINTKVADDAPALVNVVDVPSECNFIAPSVIRRGPMLIAVSTSGTSPAISKAVRKELEKSYGFEFSEYLKFTKKMRAKAFAEISGKNKRERFLKSLASEEIIHSLRTKGVESVKNIVLSRLDKFRME